MNLKKLRVDIDICTFPDVFDMTVTIYHDMDKRSHIRKCININHLESLFDVVFDETKEVLKGELKLREEK